MTVAASARNRVGPLALGLRNSAAKRNMHAPATRPGMPMAARPRPSLAGLDRPTRPLARREEAAHQDGQEDPIPKGFDWDFWVGPSPLRPYKAGVYHPGKWRGWYDFGGGSLADFCCHAFNLPVRALKLDYPAKIEASPRAATAGRWRSSSTRGAKCRPKQRWPG